MGFGLGGGDSETLEDLTAGKDVAEERGLTEREFRSRTKNAVCVRNL